MKRCRQQQQKTAPMSLTDWDLFFEQIREHFGEFTIDGERKVSDKTKVVLLNDDANFEWLIQQLKYAWRQWWIDSKPLMEVEIRFHKDRRRLEQNNLYWVYLRDVAQQMGAQMGEEPKDVRVWDEYLKRSLLGVETHIIVDQPVEMTKAHKTLGIKDFSDYMDQVFAWGAEHGVVTE